MSRHVRDVAWSIYAALPLLSNMTDESDEAPQRASWALSPPLLAASDLEAAEPELDGAWCLFADGVERGFRITVEAIDQAAAANAIFDEQAREELARRG